MAIELNHTVVPACDKVASAKFFARIFGLAFDESAVGYFAPVRINDSLTLDFAGSDRVATHHYAFKVSEDEFDAIFARIHAEGIPHGSEPFSREDMKINHRGGGRGVYFDDPTDTSLSCSRWSRGRSRKTSSSIRPSGHDNVIEIREPGRDHECQPINGPRGAGDRSEYTTTIERWSI